MDMNLDGVLAQALLDPQGPTIERALLLTRTMTPMPLPLLMYLSVSLPVPTLRTLNR